MNSASTHKYAITATLTAVIIFIAAFMPWGEIDVNIGLEAPFGGSPYDSFGTMNMGVAFTGWNSHITLVGLKLPNWLVVIAAGAVALMSCLSSFAVWKIHVTLPVVIAVYGLLHAISVLVILVGSEESSVGIGVLVTLLAFIGILVVVVRQHYAAKTVSD
jgi:hypothetical protein